MFFVWIEKKVSPGAYPCSITVVFDVEISCSQPEIQPSHFFQKIQSFISRLQWPQVTSDENEIRFALLL